MKYAICNEIFESWPIGDVFSKAAEIGYDAVEIAPYTLADSVTEIPPERRREIRSLAQDAGIEIAGLHWLLIKPDDLSIMTQNEALRRRTQDYFQELIRFCADLGGRVMVIGSPKQRAIPAGMSADEAWQIARDFFDGCLDTARETGVVLCIEPLTARETNFLIDSATAMQLVDEIHHPNFKLILDVKAMSSEKTPIPETIRQAAYYLAHFHANDANLRGPGFGDTDFVPIADALKRIRYHGYVSVEVFDFSPDPVTIAANSLDYLKRSFGDTK